MTQRIDLFGIPTDEELGPKPLRPNLFQRLRRLLFGTEYEVVRYSRYVDGGVWDYGWRWEKVAAL